MHRPAEGDCRHNWSKVNGSQQRSVDEGRPRPDQPERHLRLYPEGTFEIIHLLNPSSRWRVHHLSLWIVASMYLHVVDVTFSCI